MTFKKNLAIETLRFIFFFSAINALYIAIAPAFGLPSATTYLYVGDLYADFLKVVLSYPGAKDLVVNDSFGLAPLINNYIGANPYQGVEGLEVNALTHFHLPPLSTLISLSTLLLMKLITPQFSFYFALLLMFLMIYGIAWKIAKCKDDRLIWTLCFIFSYPFLFALQRGNFFSILSTLLSILFVIAVIADKKILYGLIFIAIAINIRPNLFFLLPTLFLLKNGKLLMNLIITILLIAVFFIFSLLIDEMIYPNYSLTNFLKGLSIYKSLFIVGGWGDAFNASIFILLKKIFGYSVIAELFGTITSCIFGVIATFYFSKKRIDATSFIFILCVLCMLSSPVFADYHMLIFLLPIITIYLKENNINNAFLATDLIFLVCIFLLAPKNYFFASGISALSLLNPIAGIFSVLLIIIMGSYSGSLRASSCEPKN